MLRVAQKLAYIYSWPDLFAGDDDDIDEATEGILTLFVGVVDGVQFAQSGVTEVSAMIAKVFSVERTYDRSDFGIAEPRDRGAVPTRN